MDILNGLTALVVGLLGCGSVTGVVAYLLHRNAERRIKNAPSGRYRPEGASVLRNQ